MELILNGPIFLAHPSLRALLNVWWLQGNNLTVWTITLASATKKVRKVDIRSALRTFQIFRYAFGTHLTQKVHILFVSDSNADII